MRGVVGVSAAVLTPTLSSLGGRRGRSRRASRENFLNSTAVHPSPLPWGEGATLAALRACVCNDNYSSHSVPIKIPCGTKTADRGWNGPLYGLVSRIPPVHPKNQGAKSDRLLAAIR